MNFSTTRVSNNEIKVEEVKIDKIKVKGGDWYAEPYANTWMLAKKMSGKTTTIDNSLEHTAGKNTKFIFIVPTINKDAKWINIVNKWENRGNDVLTYTELEDEDGNNILKDFIESHKEQEELPTITKIVAPAKKIDYKQSKQLGRGLLLASASGYIPQLGGQQVREVVEVQKPKKSKSKVVYPEYIFVLDDLGKATRDKWVAQLLKTNRHYKCKVFISSQNITDLQPESIGQLDYVLAFGNIPDERIEKLREDLDLPMPEDKFLALYKDATKDKYQFLYIGRDNIDGITFRKGFNYRYNIEDESE